MRAKTEIVFECGKETCNFNGNACRFLSTVAFSHSYRCLLYSETKAGIIKYPQMKKNRDGGVPKCSDCIKNTVMNNKNKLTKD